MNGTYSPEDNKLRLYPDSRLPKELYERVRAAGFIWAPKQELFVAPMWTPSREDLLVELCGEVGDEDTSLVERAEQRADRFKDYSEHRAQDAAQAKATVDSICEGIPLGQPILVGHHSERHARRDAERIENGMRRAVKMWDTSKYWTDRAAGAVRAAKYKERPDVRARRIKKLEAEKRKVERNQADNKRGLRFWEGKFVTTNKETGEKTPFEITEANKERICKALGCDSELSRLGVVKNDHGSMWSAWDVLLPDGERYAACPAYTVAQVQAVAFERYPKSIAYWQRWIDHYSNRLAYERAMQVENGGTAADRKGPEKGGACRCWASPGRFDGGWSYIQKVNRVSVTVLDNWGNGGANFTRNIEFDKLTAIMTAAEVQAARDSGRLVEVEDKRGFFLRENAAEVKAAQPKPAPVASDFDAMRETLKAGVQVVTAPNLFPTPPALAARMVELAFAQGWGVQVCAEMNDRCRILEPSAGTGNLLAAIAAASNLSRSTLFDLVAVEINPRLALALNNSVAQKVIQADFLTCNGNLGKFDRILMNPPFDHGSDIAHIKHALTFLADGGRLVAICANGPRQQEELQPLATEWIDLEPGTFKEQGTNVNCALLVIDK